ncbi:peptidoglycan-binding protein [Streptomyces sp. NPDC059002]|uniref:peptidoglycan-binding domain-containing protein n=1 Tax=Streptomyces sp. NPDC059002 TaxID=3346690 RepID=UPI00367859A8
MGEQDGQRCPECGATRAPGSAPECGCTRRAADEARRTRSAEAAAAEDFNPLRIRPYVSLPEPEGPPAPADLRLFATAGPDQPTPPAAGPPETPGTSGLPAPSSSYDEETRPQEEVRYEEGKRKRRYVLLAGAGAVAAVAAAAVFATGLFSSAADRPTRDLALPDAPTTAPRTPTTSSAPAPAAKPSTPPSPAPAHTPSATRPPPSPSRSTRPPSAPPSTARATGSVDTATPPPRRNDSATLREGDKGPRVTELQGRLSQLYLYVGEQNGTYSPEVTAAVTRYQWARGIRGDRTGEYGRATRRSLESETTHP